MTADHFVTDSGERVPAITTEQMRDVDRIAIEELGPNLYQMMENAGRSLATTVLERLEDRWGSTPIAVLAGTGGNGVGGDVPPRLFDHRFRLQLQRGHAPPSQPV